MTAWSPWERRLCFLLPFTMRALLTGLRATSIGGGDPASITHVVLQVSVIFFILIFTYIPFISIDKFSGCSFGNWRCDRRNEYTRALVPRSRGSVSKFSQYYACFSSHSCLFDAPGM